MKPEIPLPIEKPRHSDALLAVAKTMRRRGDFKSAEYFAFRALEEATAELRDLAEEETPTRTERFYQFLRGVGQAYQQHANDPTEREQRIRLAVYSAAAYLACC